MAEETSNTAVLKWPHDQAGGCKWEYSVISIHSRHNDQLEHAFNEKGTQGWELVFVQVPMPNEFHCIFRRPVP